MSVEASEVISIGIGTASLIGLYLGAKNKRTQWPVSSSILKLVIYSLIIALNVLQGWLYALVPNGLALVAWFFMAVRRGIPRQESFPGE